MAVKSRVVEITDEPTRIDSATDQSGDRQYGQSLAFYNDGDATIYVGGPDVTTETGCPVAAASWSPGFDLGPTDLLYGIVEASTCDARVLEVGV